MCQASLAPQRHTCICGALSIQRQLAACVEQSVQQARGPAPTATRQVLVVPRVLRSGPCCICAGVVCTCAARAVGAAAAAAVCAVAVCAVGVCAGAGAGAAASRDRAAWQSGVCCQLSAGSNSSGRQQVPAQA